MQSSKTSAMELGSSVGWMKGPADEAGKVINLSDRPSLCMSVRGSEAVVGSSDHALYVVDVERGKFSRALYGGSLGHKDWVTCVDHLGDGRIISGGMDSKLCVWEKKGSVLRCRDLKGHSASISDVKVVEVGSFGGYCSRAVSCSYDKTLMIWDVSISNSTPQKPAVARLIGHKAPVMGFTLGSRQQPCGQQQLLLSGCRNGEVILWDVEECAVLQRKDAHRGHVTVLRSIGQLLDQAFVTGGQDGVLQVWDFRTSTPIHTASLHSSGKGTGALSCIAVAEGDTTGRAFIVTAGADRALKVLDPRSSFRVIHAIQDHTDFVYSLCVSGMLAWSGGGDGSLLVHDLVTGKCLYGLGAISNGAVRCIDHGGQQNDKLIATGDDGNLIVYSL